MTTLRPSWRVQRFAERKKTIWAAIPINEKKEIELISRKLFPQVPFWDMCYIYRYRHKQLLILINGLEDTSKAGKDWLFWATGAMKEHEGHVDLWMKRNPNIPIYSWLKRHNERKKRQPKTVLQKKHTYGKLPQPRRRLIPTTQGTEHDRSTQKE